MLWRGWQYEPGLYSRFALAHKLEIEGDFEGARDLYLKALNEQERALGDDHPDTLTSANHLSCILFHIIALHPHFALLKSRNTNNC